MHNFQYPKEWEEVGLRIYISHELLIIKTLLIPFPLFLQKHQNRTN